MKPDGQCRQCPNPVKPGLKHCAICLAKAKAYAAERRRSFGIQARQWKVCRKCGARKYTHIKKYFYICSECINYHRPRPITE